MSRRFSLGRALASENWNEEEYPNQISAEEADVMNQEAVAIGNEIERDIESVDATLDKADSLEDMAVVADEIVEATPGEVALAQIAGDMATAGDEELTGDDVVEVAAESNGVRRIAAESLREKVSTIWENIKKVLKEIWAKVEKFFYNIFGNIPRLRKEVEAMRKRAEQIEEDGKVQKSENAKLEFANGVESLKVNQAPAKNNTELSNGFEASLKVAKYLSKSSDLANFGKSLKEAIEAFEPADSAGNTDAGLAKVVEKVKAKDFFVFAANDNVSNLLGGRDFKVTLPTFGDKVGVAALEEARKFRVQFETSGGKSVKKDAATFTALKTNEVEALLDKVEEMLDALEEFHRGKSRKEMMKYASEIEKACDKVSKEANSLDSETENRQTLVSNSRAVFRLSTMYAKMANVVSGQLFTHSLANVRAVLMVCSRSLSTYTKD